MLKLRLEFCRRGIRDRGTRPANKVDVLFPSAPLLSEIRRKLNPSGSQRLQIACFSLETHYHGLPEEVDQANAIRVYFDNVVIAQKYIGPVRTENPKDGR